MAWRLFLVLVEPLPITGNTLVADPFADGRWQMVAGGGDQPVIIVAFENQPGQTVTRSIDEADGIGRGIDEMGAFGDGVLEEADHGCVGP